MNDDKAVADSVAGILSAVGVYLGDRPEPAAAPAPRLTFWGIWPLKCVCGLSLGRLAWALDDGETTRWVDARVDCHVCNTEYSRGHGRITQCTVNRVPTHNMCLVSAEEYARIQSLVAGPRGET